MVRTPGYPPSASAWSREVTAVDALSAARRIAPRPLLVLVGTADASVSIDEARQLEAAAGEGGEFLMVGGAGHELRHDPRAIASLLGWFERQVV
jgi:putative redox protein